MEELYRHHQHHLGEGEGAVEAGRKLYTNLVVLQDREFTGKVVEIVNGDALVVKVGKVFKKIHLASIRSGVGDQCC